MVRLQGGEPGLNLLDPGLVFLKEDGAASVVQSGPHRAIVAQPEDQEIARGFLGEDAEAYGDFFVGLLWGDVGGGVVDEGFGDGGLDLVACVVIGGGRWLLRARW